jgi:hypothetical protein
MKKVLSVLLTLALVIGLVSAVGSSASAATIKTISLVGDLQKALGNENNWDPASTKTRMSSADGVNYWFVANLPAGDYQYKVAFNNGWTESYGADGKKDGDNIKISLGYDKVVTFFYNDTTHKITTSRTIALVGDLQQALGASGNWDPATTKTQMYTVDGQNYIYTATLPKGNYEYKVAVNGGWGENYGANGKAGGDNIKIAQAEDGKVTFVYNDTTHLIYVGKQVALVGDLQQALGSANNWDPATTVTVMTPQKDGTYAFQSTLAKGSYQYKVALGGDWTINYGADGKMGGDNIKLTVAADGPYKFVYNDTTHKITADPVITKKIYATKIAFKYSTIRLKKGFTYQTAITTTPKVITEKGFTYKSSKTSVATVDENGKITAKNVGKATITVTNPDKKVTATMTIEVIK